MVLRTWTAVEEVPVEMATAATTAAITTHSRASSATNRRAARRGRGCRRADRAEAPTGAGRGSARRAGRVRVAPVAVSGVPREATRVAAVGGWRESTRVAPVEGVG